MLITYLHPHTIPNNAPTGKLFVAYSTFSEKDALKTAGFRWGPGLTVDAGDGAKGHWWTDEPAVAARLADYCDEQARIEIEHMVTSFEASRQVFADGSSLPAPDGLSYLPFQAAGIQYALQRDNTLFGDDMGLGKTIQAIGVMNVTQPESVLIVCPATLRRNWRRELRRWLTYETTIGIATASEGWPTDVDIVITSYNLLDRWPEHLSQTFDLVIMDEAHYIKNPNAVRSQQAYHIPAERMLLLTGTPVVNRPKEIFPLLTLLDPDRWGGKSRRINRYIDFKNPKSGRRLEELHDILRSTVMVRRLKSEVLTELPQKRRQIIALEPTKEIEDLIDQQAALLREELDEGTDTALAKLLASGNMVKSPAGAEQLSLIRRLLAEAKVNLVVKHVEELLESVEKVVVFAHHDSVKQALTERFSKYGSVLLTGGTNEADREKAVDRFQNDESVRVFVGSILAAGVGITLTAADTVVFAELDWVPGNVKQAEDRCHRIGAEIHDSILIQYLIVEGTLDEYIANTVAEKLHIIEQVVDSKRMEPIKVETIAQETARKMNVKRGKPQTTDLWERRYSDEITPAEALAVKQGLQIVAGMDHDRAAERNGVGFSKFDGDFGHDLASKQGDLSPKQALAGRRLLRKYRRQVPSDVLEAAGIQV